MSSPIAVRRVLNACAVAAALAVTSGPLLGQTRAVLERYTAMAVNMGNVGRPGAEHGADRRQPLVDRRRAGIA